MMLSCCRCCRCCRDISSGFRWSGNGAPRRGRECRSRPRSATIRPFSITCPRSASDTIRSRFCSTSRTATPVSLVERPDVAGDVLDDRRLDALGRLVEQHQLRLADHGAGDGKLLLLAARQRAGPLSCALLEDGKERDRRGRSPACCARCPAISPTIRFSRTVSSGKTSRPCGI